MHAHHFSERDLFGFGDIATFKNDQISLSDHGLLSMVIIKFDLSESAQKIQATTNLCQMHAHQFW